MIYSKISILGMMLSSVLLSGCVQTSVTDKNIETKTIKVWVIAPLSWPWASLWEDAVNVYKQWVDDFNKTSEDVKIQLIIEDGKCNAKDATSAAQKLVNIDQVKIIIWGICSSETLAAAKITQSAKVVLLSPVSSSPEISKVWDYVYRYYNDINQASTISEFLKKKWRTKIALIYENTDYGLGLANALKNKIWWENVVIEEKFNPEEKDFGIIAKKIASKKEEIQSVIYIPNTDTSAINVIKSLKKEWLLETFKGKIIWSEASYWASIIKELWVETTNNLLTAQLPGANMLDTSAKKFLDEFKKNNTIKYGETFVILYKEALNLVLNGLSNNAYNEEKLNQYIKSIAKNNPIQGLIGSYYFDGTDAIGISFTIKKIENGSLVEPN